MLKRVCKIKELRQYGNNVTVLYRSKDDDVIDLCIKMGYKYLPSDRATGIEQRVIILLNTTIAPEYITRGTNLLIMITNNRSVLPTLLCFPKNAVPIVNILWYTLILYVSKR